MIIYKVTNKVNNKVYIGQTIRSFNKRRQEHLYDALHNRDNVPFHNALMKYGFENFTWEILIECTTIEDLNAMEIKYISEYKSYDSEFGYNLKLGGENGGTCQESTKLKIGIQSKKNWENPELAERMLNGLKKGTQTMKQKAKENYVELTCVVCGKKIKRKPYEHQNKCCSKECASQLQKIHNPGLEMANKKNKENLEKRQENIRQIAIEWVKNNSEIVKTSKMNKLTWLEDIMACTGIEDQRTLAKAFGVSGRKALVNYFKTLVN